MENYSLKITEAAIASVEARLESFYALEECSRGMSRCDEAIRRNEAALAVLLRQKKELEKELEK